MPYVPYRNALSTVNIHSLRRVSAHVWRERRFSAALQCTEIHCKALKCTAMHHTVEHSAHCKIPSAQFTVYSAQCPRARRESNARHVSTQLLSHNYTAGELGKQIGLTVNSYSAVHSYCHSVTQLLSPQLLSHSYCVHSYCHKAIQQGIMETERTHSWQVCYTAQHSCDTNVRHSST